MNYMCFCTILPHGERNMVLSVANKTDQTAGVGGVALHLCTASLKSPIIHLIH